MGKRDIAAERGLTQEEYLERQREAGRKGAQIVNARATERVKVRNDMRARMAMAKASEKVGKELLDAALGAGDWSKDGQPVLDPKDRFAALKFCFEYGVGRPRPMDAEKPDDEDEPKLGIKFGVRALEEDDPELAEPEGGASYPYDDEKGVLGLDPDVTEDADAQLP